MKKNGFTLVEMMAVIVLVSLLAVIGVATYTNVNESAKQKTLESKKEQIRSSALKWAKENNITNKTIISVNALVVEGYLTADENKIGEIGLIENPVTGENMICNTVDITIKDGEHVATVNDNEQNCTLATQSLVDTNINIKVVDESNLDKTGSGSIAAWTNKNVMIIVSSSSYDSRATSISYDFEGNTITKPKSGLQKYTGNAYLSEGAAENYYNVFHVNAALILNTKVIVTYNIAGENSKSRAYTIRIDKEEATANVSSNSEWLTVDKDVYITVDDGKGSGPKYFYITKAPTETLSSANRYNAGYKTKVEGLEVGKYYVWTEDNAGNKSSKYKIILELNNVDKTVPACEVVFHGNVGNHGWYKEVPVTPGGRNTVKAGLSGMDVGVNTSQSDPEYSAFAAYNEFNEGLGTTRTTNTSKSGVNYYCHAKTLAGNYANATRNLKLDMTPPTITVATTSDTTYTKHKSINVTTSDSLSGLEGELRLRYGWGLNGAAPTNWTTDVINLTSNVSSFTMQFTGDATLTGIYTLYIDFSDAMDAAGNKATKVNGSGSGGIATFGPYHFDNTPPVCESNNGKTTPTKGSYTIRQICADNDGTDDQSGCQKRTWPVYYTSLNTVQTDSVEISDKAGNTTICPYDVYLDNIKPVCSLSEPGADGNNGWYKSSSVTITASFSDRYAGNYQSGVSSKGTAKTANSTNGNTSVTFTENGTSLTAYCYVKDAAGNENSSSLTFKKDDGSAATTCTHEDNPSWTNSYSMKYKLVNAFLSGCAGNGTHGHGSLSGSLACETVDHVKIKKGSYKEMQTVNTSYCSNSGVCFTCPTMDIYVRVDRADPTCTYKKTATGTGGVSASISCSDEGSGVKTCNGSSGTTSSVSGKTSSTTISVEDNVGNTGSCTIPVTAKDCNCSDCKTGHNTCKGGYVEKTKKYRTETACNYGCPSGAGGCGETLNGDVICTYSVYSDCATGENTCAYGCDTCYE